MIRQREHTACWQLWFCMLFTWACMLHGAQRQAKHVRSMPVGPRISKSETARDSRQARRLSREARSHFRHDAAAQRDQVAGAGWCAQLKDFDSQTAKAVSSTSARLRMDSARLNQIGIRLGVAGREGADNTIAGSKEVMRAAVWHVSRDGRSRPSLIHTEMAHATRRESIRFCGDARSAAKKR